MADDSGLMDWQPQTPPPAFNPYQGDYMPGGWPAEPPTPLYRTTGQFDVPRRRGTLEEYILPAAKRICTGLFHATITVTKAVVTVPTYAIVRGVRRRQLERARRPATQVARPARRVLAQTPSPRTPRQQLRQVALAEHSPIETPEQRPRHATVNEHSPLETPEQLPGQVTVTEHAFLEIPEQQETIRVTPHPNKQEKVRPNIPLEVPDFIPDYLKNGGRKNSMQRRYLRNGFPGMIRLSPRQRLQAIVRPRSAPRLQQPLPLAKDVQIQSPVPLLPPQPATPPSPATSIATDKSATPSRQLQEDLQAATPGTPLQHIPNESDSNGVTVVSSVTTSRKRRIDTQGSRDSEGTTTPTAKKFQTQGPSFASPNTPTPNCAIVERPATDAASVEALSTPVKTPLLSPSTFRHRKLTPKSLKTPLRTLINSSKTPPSAISSTCDVSPGNYHIDGLAAVRSPVKNELSSFFEGTPPTNTEQNAQVFKMITTGGGSPTPNSRKLTKSEEVLQTSGSNVGGAKLQASGHTSTGNTSAVEETEDRRLEEIASLPAETTSDAPLGLADQEVFSYTNDIVAVEQATSLKEAETEIKQPSTTSTTKQTTNITQSIDLTDDNESDESSSSTTSTTSDLQTPEKQLAQLTLDQDIYQTPDQPTPKATQHSAEKTTRKTRANTRRETKVLERTQWNIVELAAEHETAIRDALKNGHKGSKLAASDFTRVVSHITGRKGTDNWLNDEIINAYLRLVINHGNKDDRTTQVPTFHAFSSYFFNNLESKGHDGVKRWANRAKIGGKNLLETQAVFIPINTGAHWTLAVVSGKDRSATHYNSMTGSGRRYIAALKTWLAGELGTSYKEEEWTFVEAGESPLQANFDDCGVFTITSARQIMLGLTPMSYGAEMIPLQRRRIVAELVAGGLLKSSA